MTHETGARTAETVIAIWNPTLTLKICLGESIVQEPGTCEYLAPDDECEGRGL